MNQINMKQRRLKKRQAKALLQVFSLLIMFTLLVACERDMDIQTVSLDNRIDPAQLQKDQDEDPDSLLLENFYFFGIDRKDESWENTARYQVLMDYLTRQTGYEFRLLYTAEGVSIVDALGGDTVQFAGFDFAGKGMKGIGGAKSSYGISFLVRNMSDGDQVAFVVKQDSDLVNLNQLKNGRLAVYSTSSILQGDLMPRLILRLQGMKLEDINKVFYTKSAENCLESVMQDDVDACVLEEGEFNLELYSEKLRTMFASDTFPGSAVASNIYIDDEVIKAVQQALLNYDRETFKLIDKERSAVILKILNEPMARTVSE